jgi:hypothetical protein
MITMQNSITANVFISTIVNFCFGDPSGLERNETGMAQFAPPPVMKRREGVTISDPKRKISVETSVSSPRAEGRER